MVADLCDNKYAIETDKNPKPVIQKYKLNERGKYSWPVQLEIIFGKEWKQFAMWRFNSGYRRYESNQSRQHHLMLKYLECKEVLPKSRPQESVELCFCLHRLTKHFLQAWRACS